MTPGMTWLLIAWGIVTGILLLLLFQPKYADQARGRPAFYWWDCLIKGNGTATTDRQAEQDKSYGETGGRNFGLDDVGNRRLGCLHRIELGTAI